MAIKLRVGTNTRRIETVVAATDTLASVLEQNDIQTAGGIFHLKGSVVAGCDLNKTFEELGVVDGEENVSLIVSIKQDSGNN